MLWGHRAQFTFGNIPGWTFGYIQGWTCGMDIQVVLTFTFGAPIRVSQSMSAIPPCFIPGLIEFPAPSSLPHPLFLYFFVLSSRVMLLFFPQGSSRILCNQDVQSASPQDTNNLHMDAAASVDFSLF